VQRDVPVVEALCDTVEDARDLTQIGDKDSENIANARQNLQEVVAADESVVHRISVQLVAVHDREPRGGHREPVAQARLEAQAELQCNTHPSQTSVAAIFAIAHVRARLFSHAPWFEAAAAGCAEVSLTADVIIHIAAEHLHSSVC
jgi:hypothetical protein